MNDSEPAELRVELRDDVTWLTLNRPGALNSVNPPMLARFAAALDAIESGDGTRVVVITGSGEAFCSGSDLGVVAGDGAEHEAAVEHFISAVNALLNRVEGLPMPVIAALNGTTVGAGLELALCADLIVARSNARVGDGHARFGLLPGGGASARLPRRIGTAAAKWLAFTGDLLPAEQLVACGLVQQTYAPADFVGGVSALATKIAGRSPLGLRRMKSLIDAAPRRPLADALAAEREMLRLHRSSWDRAEGLAAFAAKRTPRFRGA